MISALTVPNKISIRAYKYLLGINVYNHKTKKTNYEYHSRENLETKQKQVKLSNTICKARYQILSRKQLKKKKKWSGMLKEAVKSALVK